MSSDRLNTTITDMEINLFVESLNALPEYKDVSETVCEEMAVDVQAITYGAVRRAVAELGVMKTRQYHRILLPDARFEVLVDFDSHDSAGFPRRFRATTNLVREIKTDDTRNIEIQDFAIGAQALSVAYRQAPQLLKGVPRDLLEGTLPIIGINRRGEMSRFAGSGYSLDSPKPFSEMNFTDLTQQLSWGRALNALMSQLSREVTLEQEYPYERRG